MVKAMHPHLIQIEPDDTARARQRQVKVWVREALALPEETVVTVTESRCPDPACPLMEMVILVHDADPARVFRIAHPKVALTKTHVLQGLAR